MRDYKDLQKHLTEKVEQAEKDKRKSEDYWTGYIAALNQLTSDINEDDGRIA